MKSRKLRRYSPRPLEPKREMLRRSFLSMSLLVAGGMLTRCSDETDAATGSSGSGQGGDGSGGGVGGGGGAGGGSPAKMSNIHNLGPLQDPDANGVRMPAGFTSRIVARSSSAVENSSHVWHGAPDGGAVFATDDGGWILVSNSEIVGTGGVGAIRFAADGTVADAYPILTGTSRNCAGGLTPWGTWLSCEEVSDGHVFECDPTGAQTATDWPALGVFNHEAVAVDPTSGYLYLTEDEPDGNLYRFVSSNIADGRPDLSAGALEVAQVAGGVEGTVSWLPVPYPDGGSGNPTRYQVSGAAGFAGGEGIWFHDGVVYFTTKGDNRVWALDLTTNELIIIYDRSNSPSPILSGVDNVTVSPGGDVLVAEDGGDLEIVALTPDGQVLPLMQLVGHNASEITGPCFDPSCTRLYFSSQRGTSGASAAGITFEMSGPFFV